MNWKLLTVAAFASVLWVGCGEESSTSSKKDNKDPASSSSQTTNSSSSGEVGESSSSEAEVVGWDGGSGSVWDRLFPAGNVVLDGEPGGYWYNYNDSADGGNTVVSPGNGEGEFEAAIAELGYLRADVTIGDTSESNLYPFGGVAFDWIPVDMGEDKLPGDLSAHTILCVSYKSNTTVTINMTQVGQPGFDSFSANIAKSEEVINTMQIPFYRFFQGGWGDAFDKDLEAQEALQFQLKGRPGDELWLEIYSIGFESECD
jgi:hypothetical protein